MIGEFHAKFFHEYLCVLRISLPPATPPLCCANQFTHCRLLFFPFANEFALQVRIGAQPLVNPVPLAPTPKAHNVINMSDNNQTPSTMSVQRKLKNIFAKNPNFHQTRPKASLLSHAWPRAHMLTHLLDGILEWEFDVIHSPPHAPVQHHAPNWVASSGDI